MTLTGVSVLLALSVYQVIINEKLPTSSDEVPVVGNCFNSLFVALSNVRTRACLVCMSSHRTMSQFVPQ